MKHRGVHNWFSQTAAGAPDATAVEYGDSRMTYRDLDEKSNNLANFLVASGAMKGSTVAILAEDGVNIITAIIATLKAGCVFVPLDPRLPKKRLADILGEVSARWFIAEAALLERLPASSAGNIICLDAPDASDLKGDLICLKGYAGFRELRSPGVASGPDDPCYIYFTSGSTGRPKGIVGRLKSVEHFVNWEIETFGIDESSRVSQLTSPSFDAYLRDVFVPLCAGGTVCGPEGRRAMADTEALINWISRAGITQLHCVPSLLRMMLSYGLKASDFESLKYVLLAGEVVLPSDVLKWNEAFGDRIQLVNMYGPTETTMTKLFYFIKPSDGEGRSIPVGKPMEGAKALLLDPKGKPVRPGLVGEIYIRTPYRSLGYYNQPELTREVFIPNPFTNDPDDLIYRTGDLGRVLEDGNLAFLGRKDQQVKVRGVRVELGEIEDLLLKHEHVREAAVIDREDNTGNKYLCGYVVCDPEVAPEELKQYLAGALPEYLVPSMMVKIEKLPRTITGKIDRRSLALEQARAEKARAEAYVPPRTPEEEIVAAIFADVLKLQQVGRQESLFEMGGHSLSAMQVITRVRLAFDVELPLRALFESPTVEEVAKQVESARKQGGASSVPPLKRADRSQPLPLSYAQQRLWFFEQLQPDTPLYNLTGAARLSGDLNVPALEKTLSEIVRRHEALRTTFGLADGRASQIVAPATPVRLPIDDISELPEDEREQQALNLVAAEAGTPFDLATGPLMRSRLIRLAPTEHIALFTMHHIISDGWSMGVLLREIEILYTAYSRDESSPLPELSIQYGDYSVWQREWLQGEMLENQFAYWKRQLAGIPSVLELPTDRPRPALQSHCGTYFTATLSPELGSAIAELNKREGVTLYMILVASLQVLLSRYSGQDDIVVGTSVGNRTNPQLEPLIGFFVNLLVIRIGLFDNPSFREVLGRARATALAAFAHQDIPFEALVDAIQPERRLSQTPLFQVNFVLQNQPSHPFQLGDLYWEPLAIDNGTVKFDLTLSVTESEQGLVTAWHYRTDLFDALTIERMSGHFRQLLESAVASPLQRLSELAILTPAEQRQMLVDWNDTRRAFPSTHCIQDLIKAQVERGPERVAIAADGECLTYGELDERSNQLGHYLREQGVGPGVLVGICMERAPEMTVSVLAVLKAGAGYVPIDPSYPVQRQAGMLNDCSIWLLLTQERLIDDLPAGSVRVVAVDEEWDSFIAPQSRKPVSPLATEADPAYVIFTSGSTGRPKGMLLRHQGLCNLIVESNELFDVHDNSRLLQFSALGFDVSVWETFMALCAGGTLCLGNQNTSFSLSDLHERLRAQQITVALLPPSVLRLLPSDDLPALRTVIAVGEKCTAQNVAQWARGRNFFNGYGPAEATVTVSAHLTSVEEDFPQGPPIGHPMGNNEFYILNRYLQPVPVGVAGELCIGGIQLALGYVHRPELTAEKFIPHPFSRAEGARLYRTGDLARYLADGNLEYVGRVDRQVKVRGFRIELGEIETVLMESGIVKEAVVSMHEQSPGDRRLVTYFVGHQQNGSAESEQLQKSLRAYLRERVPDYMVPSAFMHLEALPLTAHGKIDRQALPLPEYAGADPDREFVAPGTETEQTIAAIWQDVLKVDRFSIHDNFFDLGGHSLLLAEVHTRLCDTFKRDLPMVDLFRFTTISTLSSYLSQDKAEAPSLSQFQDRAKMQREARRQQKNQVKRRGN